LRQRKILFFCETGLFNIITGKKEYKYQTIGLEVWDEESERCDRNMKQKFSHWTGGRDNACIYGQCSFPFLPTCNQWTSSSHQQQQ